MRTRAEIECWLTDMDGVLVHENTPVPGASALLQQWRDQGVPFLVLTNNSIFTPRDLRARLAVSGLEVPEESIWTSALATAKFLVDQVPGGSAYVIGEAGLTTALYETGYTLTDSDPDYVVLGETRTYSFEAITRAIRLINASLANVSGKALSLDDVYIHYVEAANSRFIGDRFMFLDTSTLRNIATAAGSKHHTLVPSL